MRYSTSSISLGPADRNVATGALSRAGGNGMQCGIGMKAGFLLVAIVLASPGAVARGISRAVPPVCSTSISPCLFLISCPPSDENTASVVYEDRRIWVYNETNVCGRCSKWRSGGCDG